MTLLTIANAVADETKGPRPATIATNTDPAAQNILRLINKVGNRLQKSFAWNILSKEGTVTASGSETLIAAAALPADFDRIIPETFWDRGTNNLISGPISPVEWQGLKVQTYDSQSTSQLVDTLYHIGSGRGARHTIISKEKFTDADTVPCPPAC